ncbi:MAG: hypothetical protein R3313_00890 [Candidatus Saccharimonadales bacterium]|nr:hypothetical protein [Candidatus Saccharimonadales bacterium]
MGLDFSDIKDETGAAVYALHNGFGAEERSVQRFCDKLGDQAKVQIICLSAREKNGARVADFYDIQTLPAILIVRDSDEIAYSWFGPDLPSVQEVSHLVKQVG